MIKRILMQKMMITTTYLTAYHIIVVVGKLRSAKPQEMQR